MRIAVLQMSPGSSCGPNNAIIACPSTEPLSIILKHEKPALISESGFLSELSAAYASLESSKRASRPFSVSIATVPGSSSMFANVDLWSAAAP